MSSAPVLAQLLPPPVPAGNPLSDAKAQLGEALFWDEQLSSTRTTACGTCHILKDGGSDPRSLDDPLAIHPGPDGVFGNADDVFGSPGVPLSNADGTYGFSDTFGMNLQVTGRRASPALNAGFSPTLFWDGRAADELVDPVTSESVLPSGAALESQALVPLTSDVEMAHSGRTWPEVLSRIEASEPLALAPRVQADLVQWIDGRDYPALFEEAFGSAGITAARVAMAMATYERGLLTNQAPFDTFLATGTGLTDQETMGRGVFVASSCDRCHSLEIMSDHDFHYTGVRPVEEDAGRFDVTALEEDRGKMRTPSLRNVELRPPYMRNGRFTNLLQVVEFYNRGGDFEHANKDPLIRELNLTQERKEALVAFLKRPLNDPRVAAGEENFEHPELFSLSDRVPQISGAGVANSEGNTPRMVAMEPPLVGNPSFTVALYDAGPGSQATLVIDSQDPGLTLPASGELAFETVDLETATGGTRFASVSLSLADDPLLVGQQWFGRWYVPGAGEAGGTAVSPLVIFTVFSSLNSGLLFMDGFESGNLNRWSSVSP